MDPQLATAPSEALVFQDVINLTDFLYGRQALSRIQLHTCSILNNREDPTPVLTISG